MSTFEVDDFNFARMLASISVSIGPGACFRRSVLDLVGYRNPLLRYSADLDYWFRIALAGEIVHVRETLATHRTHPGSAIVAARGDLMAREVAYLFQAYGRHPRAPRRIAGAADAHGHFAAAFVCTDPRSAARELLLSIRADPITFFACLERNGGADATISFLQQLGGKAGSGAAASFDTINVAPNRSSAFRLVARAALRDPVACLQAAREIGLASLGRLDSAVAARFWNARSSITTCTSPAWRKTARVGGNPAYAFVHEFEFDLSTPFEPRQAKGISPQSGCGPEPGQTRPTADLTPFA